MPQRDTSFSSDYCERKWCTSVFSNLAAHRHHLGYLKCTYLGDSDSLGVGGALEAAFEDTAVLSDAGEPSIPL